MLQDLTLWLEHRLLLISSSLWLYLINFPGSIVHNSSMSISTIRVVCKKSFYMIFACLACVFNVSFDKTLAYVTLFCCCSNASNAICVSRLWMNTILLDDTRWDDVGRKKKRNCIFFVLWIISEQAIQATNSRRFLPSQLLSCVIN
jgi:hypothetical protein